MIREGSASKNLKALLPFFDKYSDRCMLVTDDKEVNDLINFGHLDSTIKIALKYKKDLITAISMTTINPAKYFNLDKVGIIKEGYYANLTIINNLKTLKINQVYHHGKLVFDKNKIVNFPKTKINLKKYKSIFNSINFKKLNLNDLKIKTKGKHLVRVIELIPGKITTKETIETLNFNINNGIDTKKDVLKIVVVERHNQTGHIGIGFIKGLGLKTGAIASTVSHDSHNVIAIGSCDEDILFAINQLKKINGGNVLVKNKKLLDSFALPIGGLMSNKPVEETAKESEKIRNAVYKLGVKTTIAPFMNMSFISLPVIPQLKITTKGLVDVNKNKLIDLIVK